MKMAKIIKGIAVFSVFGVGSLGLGLFSAVGGGSVWWPLFIGWIAFWVLVGLLAELFSPSY